MEAINGFLMGGIAVGYAIAALFFLRFWHKTRDRLFVMFSISFALLSAIRVILFSLTLYEAHDVSEDHFIYWFRFAAYMLILFAIIDKNREK